MSKLRTTIGIVAALALVAGYAASQWAFVRGDAAAYAAAVDRPPIHILALIVLAAAVVSSFVKSDDSGAEG